MVRRVVYNLPGHAHFLTFSVARRVPVLARSAAAELFLGRLRHCCVQHEFDLWAFVVMPDHCHLIVQPRNEAYDIATFLRSLKQPSAARIVPILEPHERAQLSGRAGGPRRLWETGGGYDRNLYSPPEIWKSIRYAHHNPVRKGLCREPEEYPWSSALAYAGQPSPIPVELCPVVEPSEGVHWSSWPG